jgi:hypothetical protein
MQKNCEMSEIYNFNIDYDKFEIPCEIVDAGVDEVYYYVLGDFVMKSYYAEYNCSILKCLEEIKSPSFLISLKTKNYASSKFYSLIFFSLILIGFMFLLIETKSNLSFVVGFFLVIISIPFLKLDSALAFIDDKLVLSFVSIFFTKTYSVFARFMFFGISLILIGIIWKLFIIGFKINNLVNWFKTKLQTTSHLSSAVASNERMEKNREKEKTEKISKEKKFWKKNQQPRSRAGGVYELKLAGY